MIQMPNMNDASTTSSSATGGKINIGSVISGGSSFGLVKTAFLVFGGLFIFKVLTKKKKGKR